jgi:NAD(P)-dependent dehydrogenase (short-subunit alcohol dehydrogenase family)
VVLITGASSGLGKSTAELLSAKGMRVFGTSRKTGGERVDGYDLLPLDVDSDSSVDRCVKSVMEKTNRLDVLVNNAGQVPAGAIEETTMTEAKSVFETNFFGAVRMVNAVLPIMKKQNEGLIINVASLAAIIPTPIRAFYSASKAALGTYSDVLRYEVRRFGIRVCAVYPGFFNTGAENRTLLPSVPLDEYKQMRNNVIAVRANDLQNGDDPKLLAETILRIIRTKSPKASYMVGKGTMNRVLKSMLPRSGFESLIERHYKLND